MLLRKKNVFTASEMMQMEKELRSSALYSNNLKADDEELTSKLKLEVVYVDDMGDNEAKLLPPTDSNKYFGTIMLNKESRNEKFGYIHEIMHYIFDVGYGNKVDSEFARKKKGKTKDHAEQITNYKTAAFIMPYEEILKEIERYDSSHPRLDEIKFVEELKQKYEQDEVAIFRRIKEVRMLSKNNFV